MAPRALTAFTTLVVAILLAFTVPVSQLRTASITKSCCCPDPKHCHCPDHCPTKDSKSQIRACHQSQEVVVAPVLPAFTQPVIAMAPAPARPVALIVHQIHDPHAAPAPVRPAAPS